MKITRNGIEYRLTDMEIEQAYRERENDYYKADLLDRLSQMLDLDGYDDELMGDPEKEYGIGNRTVTGKQLKELVDNPEWMNDLNLEFRHALENNDSYWESFWMTAEDVIADKIDKSIPKSEKELKRDANKEKYKSLIAEINRSPLPYKEKSDLINRLINEGCDSNEN